MSSTTVTERAPEHREEPGRRKGLDRVLGHPLAFVATAAILLSLFGATFLVNPDRVAPTKDPAYYTWRTEALMTEDPATVLDIKGPFDFFSSGYRVSAPVTGALLRHIPGVSELHTTVFLMVLVPVLTALLLAGFAYRQRRDPLLWHSVAFFSASLYLTPPFVGYLDNILCLFFLAASLSFIRAARDSWPTRIGFGLCLIGAGLTHPTTLVFFGLTLGLMSAVRLVWRRFDFRSVIADDSPMLLTALAAAVVTVVIWTLGIWGESAALQDAALAPPYGSDFFLDRLGLWIKAMRPLFNGPLLLVGLVGLLAAGKRWVDDDLARVSVLWLAPLAGIFGFVGGLTYPYYRFFNTTLAWILLVGVGGFFLVRFLLARSSIAGYVGLALLAFIVATNFTSGYDTSGWNNADGGWISGAARTDLDALRAQLAGLEGDDRPVVFVIDQDEHTPQVYGYTKLSGNTSRYGLPDGQIDQGFIYLGSLENLVNGEPTTVGEDTYDELSAETLNDIESNASGGEPIYVVAAAFNATGANTGIASGEASPLDEGEVWVVQGGQVTSSSGELPPPEDLMDDESSSPLHLIQVIGGLALLLLPGLLAFRFFVGDAGLAEGLGMVPALSLALLSFAGVIVVAVARGPFSLPIALITLGLAVGAGALLFIKAWASAPSATKAT